MEIWLYWQASNEAYNNIMSLLRKNIILRNSKCAIIPLSKGENYGKRLSRSIKNRFGN